MRAAALEKLFRYGLNVPVLAAAVLVISLVFFGISSRSDVCGDYNAMGTHLNKMYLYQDPALNSSIDSLVSTAKNYSDDSTVQADAASLDSVHTGTFTLSQVAGATQHIATMCGYSLPSN